MLQIYFDRIENTAPGATQRAHQAALRWISQAAKQAAKAALQTAAPAHPAPEEAGITPRQHTAFAPQRPWLHGMLAAVFLPYLAGTRTLKGHCP
jgi:hypothetical protein